MARYWIQDVARHKGMLHRQLGIPTSSKIPVSMLRNIQGKKVGEHIRIRGGSREVTGLMKKRANLAMTLRNLRR